MDLFEFYNKYAKELMYLIIYGKNASSSFQQTLHYFKEKWYTFKGGSCQFVLPPFKKRVLLLKGKNLLPLGANSFLLE